MVRFPSWTVFVVPHMAMWDDKAVMEGEIIPGF